MKWICGAGGGGVNKVHYGLCEIGEFGYRYLRKQPLSELLETPLDEIFYPWEKTREMESLGGNE